MNPAYQPFMLRLDALRGLIPFKYIYNELGINDFFINKQRNLNIDFSLSRNLQLLVFSRILFPASKKSTYENRNRFFAPFNDGITKDSIYKSLDYFYRYKEEIQALIWKNTKDTYSRDISKSYYDCTNYYFEIEYNDDDIIDENGEVIEKGLRKRGPEKIIDPTRLLKWDCLWTLLAFRLPMTFFLEMSLRSFHSDPFSRKQKQILKFSERLSLQIVGSIHPTTSTTLQEEMIRNPTVWMDMFTVNQ